MDNLEPLVAPLVGPLSGPLVGRLLEPLMGWLLEPLVGRLLEPLVEPKFRGCLLIGVMEFSRRMVGPESPRPLISPSEEPGFLSMLTCPLGEQEFRCRLNAEFDFCVCVLILILTSSSSRTIGRRWRWEFRGGSTCSIRRWRGLDCGLPGCRTFGNMGSSSRHRWMRSCTRRTRSAP